MDVSSTDCGSATGWRKWSLRQGVLVIPDVELDQAVDKWTLRMSGSGRFGAAVSIARVDIVISGDN